MNQINSEILAQNEPMRYFYVTYKIETIELFYDGCFTYNSEVHPTFKELEKRAKLISNTEGKFIITYIHEFKSEQDYENFIQTKCN